MQNTDNLLWRLTNMIFIKITLGRQHHHHLLHHPHHQHQHHQHQSTEGCGAVRGQNFSNLVSHQVCKISTARHCIVVHYTVLHCTRLVQ